MKMSAPASLKFKKLKMRLTLNHWQCVGLLESIWLFTQHNAPAGDIGKHSDEDIAVGIEWSGEPEKLIRTLIETGWLDVCTKNRIVVHDWKEHAPTFLKGAMAKNNIAFAEPQKTQVKARKATCVDSAKQGAKQGAKTEVDLHLSRVLTPPQQPAPILSYPNLSNPILSEPLEDCCEPLSASQQPSAAIVQTSPTVMVFPCNGTGAKEWALNEKQVELWTDAYPGIDVLGECKKALAWIHANPLKRKTARGMSAFLNRWMGNANDNSTKRQPQQTRQQPLKTFRQQDSEDADWIAFRAAGGSRDDFERLRNNYQDPMKALEQFHE